MSSERLGWAVVTGASSGIGRAFARELAQRGYRVLAVARRRDRLEALAREIGAQQRLVEPLIADLKTADGLASIARRIGGGAEGRLIPPMKLTFACGARSSTAR